MQEALTQLHALADEVQMPMAQLAIRWAFANPGITSALVGARNVAQLEENARAGAEPLPAALVTRLNEITRPLKEKLGPSFDYYEHTSKDRTR